MSLKKVNLNSIFKTISIQDSAIDREATGEDNLKKFEDCHEMNLLKLKEDEKPTFFLINNITPEDQLEIQEEHYKIVMPEFTQEMSKEEMKKIKPTMKQEKPGQMLIKYFKAGCKKIEENGVISECNANDWPLSVLQEIGGLIMTRSVIGDEEKKH